jgi:hypothetical protein
MGLIKKIGKGLLFALILFTSLVCLDDNDENVEAVEDKLSP